MRRLYLFYLGLVLLLPVIAAACEAVEPSQSTVVPTGVILTVTETSLPFRFKPLTFTQLGDGLVGINACTENRPVGTTIRVRINTDPQGTENGEWVAPIRNAELGVPCFTPEDRPILDTNDFSPGTYLVKAEAKWNDPNWENPVIVTATYQVISGVNGHK